MDDCKDLLMKAMTRLPQTPGQKEVREWWAKIRPTHQEWGVGELAAVAVEYGGFDPVDVIAVLSDFEYLDKGQYAEPTQAMALFTELTCAQDVADQVREWKRPADFLRPLWVELVRETVGETDALKKEAEQMAKKVSHTIDTFIRVAKGEVRVALIVDGLIRKHKMSRADAEEALTKYLESREPKPVEEAA